MNNKVICYYEPINQSQHSTFSSESLKLVELWKENWVERGWDPIVLNEEYARSNKFLENVDIGNYKKNFYKYTVNNPSYLKHCYMRWYAYSKFVAENGNSLWCDYDVYNHSLYYNEYKSTYGKPTLHCQAGSVGYFDKTTSTKWLQYLEWFNNTEWIKNSKFNRRFKEEDAKIKYNINDMLLLNSYVTESELMHKCFLTFNFKPIKPTSNIFKKWKLFHIHGGVRPCNLLNPPNGCSSRVELWKYIEVLTKQQ